MYVHVSVIICTDNTDDSVSKFQGSSDLNAVFYPQAKVRRVLPIVNGLWKDIYVSTYAKPGGSFIYRAEQNYCTEHHTISSDVPHNL